MTREERILLQLINKSQFESTDDVSLNNIDLSKLYEEASCQSVLGLVSAYIPKELSDERWRTVSDQHYLSNIRYINAQDKLKQLLDSNSIPFVILKGNSSALYYRRPLLRTMGDIDLIVPNELFEKTKSVFKEAGYIEKSSTERHQEFLRDGIAYDLHSHYSHDIDLENYISSGIENPDIVSVEGHYFPMLPQLANGLVLLDHLRFHLITGIGLRHVVDWMMYVNNILDDEFWTREFQPVAAAKGLETLAIATTRLCQLYLGLSDSITWCKSADVNVCEQLLECILSSGNFGRKQGRGKSVINVSSNIKQEGLFRWLQIAGQYNWKAYQKHKWLKPFCWIYQVFRYIKQVFNSGRNNKQLKADYIIGVEKNELLKKLNIY